LFTLAPSADGVRLIICIYRSLKEYGKESIEDEDEDDDDDSAKAKKLP